MGIVYCYKLTMLTVLCWTRLDLLKVPNFTRLSVARSKTDVKKAMSLDCGVRETTSLCWLVQG